MPGTGPLRRSSTPARKKAIVDKSQVEPERFQGPAFVFSIFLIGLTFLGAYLQVSQPESFAALKIWLRLRRAVIFCAFRFLG